jgi:uncharacterized membrane-anchored protein
MRAAVPWCGKPGAEIRKTDVQGAAVIPSSRSILYAAADLSWAASQDTSTVVACVCRNAATVPLGRRLSQEALMQHWRFTFAKRIAALLCWASLLAPVSAGAPPGPAPGEPPGPPSAAAREAEATAARQAAYDAGTKGPADLALIDQASLKIPVDYLFIPKAEGTRLMRAFGNVVHEPTFVGLFAGLKPRDAWIVVVRFIKEGYIKDDDAKNWNADELLQNLKDGTEESNKDRVARGFPEIEALGWVEKPAYDPVTRRLVWSLLSKHKGAPDTPNNGINYNTYALGRDGYFSLNLLTTSSRVDADKAVAQALLGALAYNSGKRYEDFNSATDHIAEYGLAALVGGLVAKKLGMFALIGVFVAKFAKVIGVAALGLGAVFVRFFRRKPKASQPDAPA